MERDSVKSNVPPRYLQQTLASTIPEGEIVELDRIRSSFRTGSCSSIKKLPADLKSGSVQNRRKLDIIENRLRKPNTVATFFPTQKYFTNLSYKFSNFNSEEGIDFIYFVILFL